MDHLLDYSLLVFALSFTTLCLSIVIGAVVRRGRALEKGTPLSR